MYEVNKQFLPFGSFRGKHGHRNILLTGDAAGLVDPITGEGTASGLQSGEYAADSALWALGFGTRAARCSLFPVLPPFTVHTPRPQSSEPSTQMVFSEGFQPKFVKGMQRYSGMVI
jgi:hypothetical protein